MTHTAGGKMKRLLVMTHNMNGGGCERVIAQLVNAFAADGVEVLLATEYRCESFYALDARVTFLPMHNSTDCRSRDLVKTYCTLRKTAKAFCPDVILAMPEKVNVWTVLAMIGSGIPVVVSERNDPKRHPESRIKRVLRRLVYPFAAGFIFQTGEARDFFPKSIRARGVVLDNPLDLARVPAPFEGTRLPCVVSAGRLHAQKNFALLIRAFVAFYADHPDWRLVIYGEGEARGALLELAASLPQGVISLPGQSATVLDDMRSAGMFVLSSDYEGMPNVLIESMAMGLGSIATDCPCGGPRALIRDGENGLLIEVGDEQALVKAMARLADDAALCARLGEKATQIKERVALDTVAEKWRETLEKAARIGK